MGRGLHGWVANRFSSCRISPMWKPASGHRLHKFWSLVRGTPKLRIPPVTSIQSDCRNDSTSQSARPRYGAILWCSRIMVVISSVQSVLPILRHRVWIARRERDAQSCDPVGVIPVRDRVSALNGDGSRSPHRACHGDRRDSASGERREVVGGLCSGNHDGGCIRLRNVVR